MADNCSYGEPLTDQTLEARAQNFKMSQINDYFQKQCPQPENK
jgi:hypothetical protein